MLIPGQDSTAAMLVRAGFVVVLVPVNVPGFRPLLARGWHKPLDAAGPGNLTVLRHARMSAASPTIHAMLIATWILAIATLVLALSVPVAWFTWLSARRQDRDRRQREHETEAREQLLRDVKDKYVTRDSVSGAAVLGGILAVLGGLAWLDRKRG